MLVRERKADKAKAPVFLYEYQGSNDWVAQGTRSALAVVGIKVQSALWTSLAALQYACSNRFLFYQVIIIYEDDGYSYGLRTGING